MLVDSLVTAYTPDGISYTLRPAGPVSRTVAFVIDAVIQGVVAFVVLLMLTLAIGPATWAFFLTTFVLTWFYNSILEMSWSGATVGKRVMGIRVVMDNGSPLRVGSSIVRNLLRFADGFLGLYLIGYTVTVLSPGFRRLGDWAAGTMVVYASANLPHAIDGEEPWLRALSPVQPDHPVSPELKRSILDFCRRYPQLGDARANEVARTLVPTLTSDPRAAAYPADYLLSVGLAIVGVVARTEAHDPV